MWRRSRQELRPLPLVDDGALGFPGTRQMLRRESRQPDTRVGRGWRGQQTRVPGLALPSARRPSPGSRSRKEQEHHHCLVRCC